MSSVLDGDSSGVMDEIPRGWWSIVVVLSVENVVESRSKRQQKPVERRNEIRHRNNVVVIVFRTVVVFIIVVVIPHSLPWRSDREEDKVESTKKGDQYPVTLFLQGDDII